MGDAAFINDVPSKPKGAARRDVTLVFRTANVVVSIHYEQSSPSAAPAPVSADLQAGARKVADLLEHKVEG